MKYSWITKRTDIELEAYDKLSAEYFFIGKISKSQIYHSKYVRGILEPKESSIRALNNFKHENKIKEFNKINERVQKYKPAVLWWSGYVSKIKEILRYEEDPSLLLESFDYDETFRIRISTPVSKMSVSELPSPTINPTTTNGDKMIDVAQNMDKNDRYVKLLPPEALEKYMKTVNSQKTIKRQSKLSSEEMQKITK